ncbi:PTS mannose transporter subunit IID [Chelonobacter oris]|uniref:dihydroxyacetone kinase phosphoryl donor subunit DhaM n=1 Tax=Chelonobacter oris TaxID=505317 RepID=UPI0024497B61|nr:dihydroxyacetone kinase phosphoryl donor subunit DhaM [Chelonobacter oris]MDH3000766.1 PTS mannose transporter subunit IID [Chelonobacter oris]
MVNLVLVSHSATLAAGLLELMRQMCADNCKIAVAAGIDDPANPIGTDAISILQAIESVYTPDGVLVLVDLGSAILSARSALDLLDPEIAANVKISAAPLVEGAIGAVVAASGGDPLDRVEQEACLAQQAKSAQLN